jgi:hypothetical protein
MNLGNLQRGSDILQPLALLFGDALIGEQRKVCRADGDVGDRLLCRSLQAYAAARCQHSVVDRFVADCRIRAYFIVG